MPLQNGLPSQVRRPLDEPHVLAGQRRFNTAAALGLGPPPPPGSGRIARRLGLGLIGTLASIIWMWSIAPPPL